MQRELGPGDDQKMKARELGPEDGGKGIRAKMGFFLVFLMIHLLFRKFSFPFWTVLSMITSDSVVEDALRTAAAASAVGTQRRDS